MGACRDSPEFEFQRLRMVREQIEARGIRDEQVLTALRSVPRHCFVPPRLAPEAYRDSPLPIGADQTISQPYIVALMSELLGLSGSERVLEVGAGCGYQTAVLARLAREVFSVEIVESLARDAELRLKTLGIGHVHLACADGAHGWPAAAPFDAILVAAAASRVPPALLDQLKDGGRLVAPVGSGSQMLQLFLRRGAGFEKRDIIPVRFVPLTGAAERSIPDESSR